MKITVREDFGIQLEEVFSGLTLKTESGETMSICMRDTGFEFKYQGEWYFAKEGHVEKFNKSVRDNYLVEQKHIDNDDNLSPSQIIYKNILDKIF